MTVRIVAILLATVLLSSAATDQGRLWSTKKGIKVFGTLAEDRGDTLILKKEDGGFAKVKLESLTDEDQQYVAALRTGATAPDPAPAATPPAADPFADVAVDPSRVRCPTVFTYSDPEATQVEIIGDFSRWKPLAMTKNADGVWEFSVDLAPGEHGYKFRVNGGKWVFDPNNAERMTSGKYENSAITVREPSAGADRASAAP